MKDNHFRNESFERIKIIKNIRVYLDNEPGREQLALNERLKIKTALWLILKSEIESEHYNINCRLIEKNMEKIKSIVKMGDFFNSFQMLRFQKETQYRTFTGGMVSIGIIITIVIAFASMILDTVNRTTITYTLNSQRNSDPPLSVLDASTQGKFMFGVEVWGYNLSSEYRYFDVVFYQIESFYGDNYTYTPYAMEACTRQHWAMLPQTVKRFDDLAIGNWLCPTMGTLIKLGGRYSSAQYNQLSVGLYPCSNDTDPLRPCAPKEEIEAYIQAGGQQNYFTFFYINSVINADQPQYKTYFLQDRTYIVFGPQMGAQLDMYLKEMNIQSDNSIWPFQDLKKDVLYNINFAPVLYPFAVDNTTLLAIFYIMKDSAQQNYQRQVQKIFVVFSFMGGLIGAIMACLFIMNTYTSFAFQIALAFEVFKNQEDDKKLLKDSSLFSLNVLHFLKFHVYSLVKKCTQRFKSPFYEHISECREQILEQLDIRNLIKRVIFLEYCISLLLQDFQLAEIQQEKPSVPADIRKLRRRIQSTVRISEDELESDIVDTGKEHKIQGRNVLQSEEISIPEKPTQKIRPRISVVVSQTKQSVRSLAGIEEGNINIGDTIGQNVLYPSIIYDETASGIRKKMENIQKLRKSAQKGSVVSKKLLQIICYPNDNDSALSMFQKKENFE